MLTDKYHIQISSSVPEYEVFKLCSIKISLKNPASFRFLKYLSGSNFLLLQAVPSPKMYNFPFVYTLESCNDLNFRPYFQLLTYSPGVTTAGSATYLMWQILLGLNWRAFIC